MFVSELSLLSLSATSLAPSVAISFTPCLSELNTTRLCRVEVELYKCKIAFFASNHEEAIKNYNEALQINPEFSIILNDRGNAKHQLGQYEAAIKDYDKALKIKPNSFICNSNLGFISFKLKKFTNAIQFYKKALLNYPDKYRFIK